VKKTKKIKKLTLKNLKVSTLEARETPFTGAWCGSTGGRAGCVTDGSGAAVGLDAPPEFQAYTSGLLPGQGACPKVSPSSLGSSCYK
jgi:hypothetical protein